MPYGSAGQERDGGATRLSLHRQVLAPQAHRLDPFRAAFEDEGLADAGLGRNGDVVGVGEGDQGVGVTVVVDHQQRAGLGQVDQTGKGDRKRGQIYFP